MKCPKCHADNPETKQFCADCGTQLRPSEAVPLRTETLETTGHDLARGTTIAGRYEIIEELGRGGMGKVYRVEDKKIKAEIALKLIKPEISSDKKTIERFSNELKTTRMISHRNVCRMFDLGEEKGTYFITMEYVAGQDLRGFIRQSGQLTVGKAIAIGKQIAEGLAEAHRRHTSLPRPRAEALRSPSCLARLSCYWVHPSICSTRSTSCVRKSPTRATPCWRK